MKGEIERNQERQLWKLRIEAQAESGMTREQWCKQEGITVSALRYWITKFRKEEQAENAPKWLKVNVNDLNVAEIATPVPASNVIACTAASINIKYGGYTVELSDISTPEKIYEVLSILKSIC